MSVNIANDSNVFGTTMPTIYIDGVDYPLPVTEKGGREEDFPKVIKNYTDLRGNDVEIIKGYKLKAKYSWPILTPAQVNDLIIIYNTSKQKSGVKLKFNVFPVYYDIRISKFERGNAFGLFYRDSIVMEIEGTELIMRYPTADQFNLTIPIIGQGIII